ncbi:MAG: CoA ester lyase [Pseudomonadota bacterium]
MTSPADQNASSRPRRSCLYMPADKPRVLEKGKTLPADAIIFDLEDAVAPEAKDAARTGAQVAVSEGGYGARETIIRINGLDTDWGLDDIKAAVSAGPNGILAPKVIGGEDIDRLNDAMTSVGAPDTMALWVMIEMPKAILNIQEIGEAAGRTRLKGFVMGTNDLAKEYRAIATPDRLAFQTAFGMTLAAARAYDLIAIDGVYNDIQNVDGLRAECEQGRTLGFDGKTLIHPAQIDTANTVFSPAEDDVAQARDVIAAFAEPENAGKGVIKVNGKMTELLHLEEAKRIVDVAEAIAAMAET